MAVVAAVVAAALVLAYFLLRPDDKKPAGSLTGDEQAAVAAAGTEAANLATYSRANFDKDFTRALNGTTGGLKSDVTKQKATTLSTLTKGKFDLSAKVQHSALVGKADSSSSKLDAYTVLIVLYGYQSTAMDVPNPQNLQVTVEKVKGDWLASDVTLIGTQ